MKHPPASNNIVTVYRIFISEKAQGIRLMEKISLAVLILDRKHFAAASKLLPAGCILPCIKKEVYLYTSCKLSMIQL